MKIRIYCEKIGHRVSGRLTLVANNRGVRTYMDQAKTAYKIDTVTGEISIEKRRKTNERNH